MSRARSCACVLVMAGALSACGGAAPRTASSTSESSVCVLDGSPPALDLRAGDDAFLAVVLHGDDARVHVEVGALGEPPLAPATVVVEGWSLRGSVDLARDGVVRTTRALTLGAALLVPPEAEVRVIAVEAGRLLVERGRYAVDDSVSLMAPTSASVECASLGLTWALRDIDTEGREWAALGLPARTPADTRYLVARSTLDLRDAPGGNVVAHIAGVDYARELVAVEVRDGHVRVALASWAGPVLLGWTPEEALSTSPPHDTGGLGGLLGAIGGTARTLHVCTTTHPVTVRARRIAMRNDDGAVQPVAPGPLVEIGTAPAGAALVVGRASEDAVGVSPRPGTALGVGSEAEWQVLAADLADASCVDEVYDPMAALADVWTSD